MYVDVYVDADEEIKSLRLSEARSLLVRFRETQEAPAEDGLESSVTELEKGFMNLIERAVRALGKVWSAFKLENVWSVFKLGEMW